MSESETLGAFRAGTLCRMQELRKEALASISALIPKTGDSSDRVCTTIALKRCTELFNVAIGDFEVTMGHTLPEIQMQGIMRERDKLAARVEQFIDTAEHLHLLLLGPLPSTTDIDDDALIGKLQREAKALRTSLVESQHKFAHDPKKLDLEHVSLKQLWKVAANALEMAAKSNVFGQFPSSSPPSPPDAAATNDSKSPAAAAVVPSSHQLPANLNEGMLAYNDYMGEMKSASEAHDLRVELRKKEEAVRDAKAEGQATETALRTRLAEVKARFVTELDKTKLRQSKYLRKLEALHDEELSGLVTQVLAALGVSDPVAVEERVEETVGSLREKRDAALEAAMSLEEVWNAVDSDDEVKGDEEDAFHGDHPPSPTGRSLVSTFRPGGVHKWEGQSAENLKKQLDESNRQHGVHAAKYLVETKARTMEWQNQFKETVQKYEAAALQSNATVLRERAKSGAMQKAMDDMEGQLRDRNREVLALKAQLEEATAEAARVHKVAVIALRREAEQRAKDLGDELEEKKRTIERLQVKVSELNPRSRGVYKKDMWIQTDRELAVTLVEDLGLVVGRGSRSGSATFSRRFGSSKTFVTEGDGTEEDGGHRGGSTTAGSGSSSGVASPLQNASAALRRGVGRLAMVKNLSSPTAAAASSDTSRSLRDQIQQSLFDHHDDDDDGSAAGSPSGRRGSTRGGRHFSATGATLGGASSGSASAASGNKNFQMWSAVTENSKATDDQKQQQQQQLSPTSGSGHHRRPKHHHHGGGGGGAATTRPSTTPLGAATGGGTGGGAASSLGRRVPRTTSNNTSSSSGSRKPRTAGTSGGGTASAAQHDDDDGDDQGEGDFDDGRRRSEDFIDDDAELVETGPLSESTRQQQSHTSGGDGEDDQQQNEQQQSSSPVVVVSEPEAPQHMSFADIEREAEKRQENRFEEEKAHAQQQNGPLLRQASRALYSMDDDADGKEGNQQQQHPSQQSSPHHGGAAAAAAAAASSGADPLSAITGSGLGGNSMMLMGGPNQNQNQQQPAQPVVVNDSLLDPQALRKTLDIFNTANFNDAERMKALVVTSTMKPVAVGALPTTVSEKRFFLALSRVAAYCDTVMVLPKNALPYGMRLQQQLAAIGASKAPEDWRMVKKISPVEVCAISTYVNLTFSRKSDRMQLISQQQQQYNEHLLQRQHFLKNQHKMNQQQQLLPPANNNRRNSSVGGNANDAEETSRHAEEQQQHQLLVQHLNLHRNLMHRIESIYVQAESVIQKVRSANIPDNLKDVTWDDLHKWRAIDDDPSGARTVMQPRDAAQMLTQLIELIKLYGSIKKALVDQAVGANFGLVPAPGGSLAQQQQNQRQQNNSYSPPGAASSSMMMMDAPDELTGQIYGVGALPNSGVVGHGPAPPTSMSLGAHCREQHQQQIQQAGQDGGSGARIHDFANTARVRNPRSIRQLIAASNTMVRSARRHVEAQRQQAQRVQSPQFTADKLLDLRVVGHPGGSP